MYCEGLFRIDSFMCPCKQNANDTHFIFYNEHSMVSLNTAWKLHGKQSIFMRITARTDGVKQTANKPKL